MSSSRRTSRCWRPWPPATPLALLFGARALALPLLAVVGFVRRDVRAA